VFRSIEVTVVIAVSVVDEARGKWSHSVAAVFVKVLVVVMVNKVWLFVQSMRHMVSSSENRSSEIGRLNFSLK
jgi:hypothetical protein